MISIISIIILNIIIYISLLQYIIFNILYHTFIINKINDKKHQIFPNFMVKNQYIFSCYGIGLKPIKYVIIC